MNKDSRFGVIGYGSWATTLVGQLNNNGNTVNWHILNDEVRESVINDGINPKYVSDLELDTNLLKVSADVNEVVAESDIIILGAPSAYLKHTLEGLSVDLDGKFFISAIKGIIPDECVTVLQYMHDHYGVPHERLGLVSGPTHAEEVSRNKLSYLTVACASLDHAALVAERLGSKNLRMSTSTDVYGIEYAGVMKNIYAIAAGLAAGLGYGDNFLAVLIARCGKELKDFIDHVHPCERDLSNCAYLGDLLVTCYSTYSRNRRLGHLIGRGCSVKSALNEMTMIAEGYFATACIHKINAANGIDLPIAETVYHILYENARPRKAMDMLSRML